MINGVISKPEEFNIDICNTNYIARRFLENYLKKENLKDTDLNNILLKVYCTDQKNSLYFSKANTKKLMRVVEVNNDFYLQNVSKLGEFYNILKKK